MACLRPSTHHNDLHSYRRKYHGHASYLRTNHLYILSLIYQPHYASKYPVRDACLSATIPHTCFHFDRTECRSHPSGCPSSRQYSVRHVATSLPWWSRPPAFASSWPSRPICARRSSALLYRSYEIFTTVKSTYSFHRWTKGSCFCVDMLLRPPAPIWLLLPYMPPPMRLPLVSDYTLDNCELLFHG